MRRTYSARYLGIWLYTTVAQTYGLLTVASNTELRCSSDAPTALSSVLPFLSKIGAESL